MTDSIDCEDRLKQLRARRAAAPSPQPVGKRKKRRPHVAAASRVLVAGMSVSTMLGLVARWSLGDIAAGRRTEGTDEPVPAIVVDGTPILGASTNNVRAPFVAVPSAVLPSGPISPAPISPAPGPQAVAPPAAQAPIASVAPVDLSAPRTKVAPRRPTTARRHTTTKKS